MIPSEIRTMPCDIQRKEIVLGFFQMASLHQRKRLKLAVFSFSFMKYVHGITWQKNTNNTSGKVILKSLVCQEVHFEDIVKIQMNHYAWIPYITQFPIISVLVLAKYKYEG